MHRDLYVPDHVTARCDNTSIGGIVTATSRPGSPVLMFRRLRPPHGIAPVAGHIDRHGNRRQALDAEVREETGLTVVEAREITPPHGVWRDNVCRRHPGPRGFGHRWHIFRAVADGDLTPATPESADLQWVDKTRMKILLNRTIEHAHGRVSDQDFAANPGLEPVWVRFLHLAGYLSCRPGDLTAVDLLTYRSPHPQGA